MDLERENLNTAQKLMLVQGIGLINDGLQFVEWAQGFPNSLSFELYDLLIEITASFQACILNGEHDNLIVNRAKKHLQNVKNCQELNEKIQTQLKELRKQVVIEQREKNREG